MPWLALPYEDEARVAALKIRYDIKALPTLVITDITGAKVISADARQDVTSAGGSAADAYKILAQWEETLKIGVEETKQQ